MVTAMHKNGASPTKPHGFQMPARIVELEFPEDSEYHGAVVRCSRKLSLEDTFALKQAFATGDEDALSLEELRGRVTFFGEHVLLGWNLLDDDGEPLAATPENFCAQPDDFLGLVITTWATAAMGVPRPLASDSLSGPPSPERSEMTVAS